MARFASVEIDRWVKAYQADNTALLDAVPAFRRWLDEEFVPIGGGWQY